MPSPPTTRVPHTQRYWPVAPVVWPLESGWLVSKNRSITAPRSKKKLWFPSGAATNLQSKAHPSCVTTKRHTVTPHATPVWDDVSLGCLQPEIRRRLPVVPAHVAHHAGCYGLADRQRSTQEALCVVSGRAGAAHLYWMTTSLASGISFSSRHQTSNILGVNCPPGAGGAGNDIGARYAVRPIIPPCPHGRGS